MANTGQDLIASIKANKALMGVNNCTGVSVAMDIAIYGSAQDDAGTGMAITANEHTAYDEIWVGGTDSKTEVWRFLTGPGVHHFVVVTWYNHEKAPGRVYTVFMAYENKYSVGGYVDGEAPAPKGMKAYKDIWTLADLKKMFFELLTRPVAWQEYFGEVRKPDKQTNTLTCWKHKTTTLESAIANVKAYIDP
jgi:hypothetical protein